MATPAVLELLFKADTKGFDQGADNVKGKLGGIVDGLAKFGLAAGGLGVIAGGIKGIADATMGFMAGNAQFESYNTQLATLMGSASAAKDRMAELAAFGAATPFELPEIVEAEKVLLGFGLAGRKAVEVTGKSSEELRTIIGDVAAGTGAAFKEVALTFGKFSAGETGTAIARLQELGVVTKEQLTEMGVQFSKTGALISPMPVAMEAAIKIAEEKFGGGMNALSNTFEGKMSTLADTWNEVKRTMAAPLFDLAKAGLDAFLPMLQDMIPHVAAAATAFAEWLPGALDTLVRAFGPVADAVGRFIEGWQMARDDGMNPFTSAISGVAELLSGLIPEPVVQAIRDVSGALEQAAEVLTGAKDAVTSYNPTVQALGDVFVSVGQTIAAWVEGAKVVFEDVKGAVLILADAFRSHFDTIAGKVGEVWAWLDENVVPIIAAVIDTVVEKVTELKDEFDDKFGGIQGAAKLVVDWFNTHVAPTMALVFERIGLAVAGVVAFFRDNLPAIQLIVSGVFDVIVGVIQTAFSIIKGVVEIGMAIFRGDWSTAWESAKTMVSGAWDGIKKILGGIGSFLAGLVSIVMTEAGKIATGIIDGLKGGLERGWSAVTGWIDKQIAKIPESIRKLMGIASPSKVMAEIGENVVAGFRLGLAGMEEVVAWINDILGKTIGDKDVNSLEQVARAVEAIRDTTAATIETLELLMTANMPQPDQLAQKFRDLITGFEGVIEKMRQISLFADKDKLPEFGYQLSKWDVANVNAVSGALKSIADLIKGLADSVKAASELDAVDASVFDKVKVAAMAAGSIAVELAASFGSSFGSEAASKAASAVASSIEAFAGVLKTVADLKLGDIAELAADGLDVVKVNAARLRDALFESTTAFQAASDAALDHGVKAVQAFASYVKAAADAFQTAGGFKLGDVTRLTAADMVTFKDNAAVLTGALWEASKGFVAASESDITKTERGVGAFVAMIQAAADALGAGKAAADGLKEATIITATSITTHLVHLRDVVIPAVEGVVNGWDHTNAMAAKMTERVEAFAALMSAAVGAHDGIPRGELEAAIEIDKSALVRYLTRMRELIIPAVVEVVAQWDMANDKAAEWSERVGLFANLMSAVVGANEAIPGEASVQGMQINVANLKKHLTLFRDKYIPALDAVLQGWRESEETVKELLARAGSFTSLMKAVTDAEGAIPRMAEKQASYAELSAEALKTALLHVRDKLIPALDFVLQGFTYSGKVAEDLLARATAFGGMMDAIVKAYNAITSISSEAPRALSQGALDQFKASTLLLFQTMADVMREGGITAEIATVRAAAADAAGTIADGMASVLDVVAQALENPFGRIRATGQRGDTLRANLKERVKASLVAAVEAIQEAAAGLNFTLPEGLADRMAALADAFKPILEIIEGLRGGIDLRALRQLALAPGILAAGLAGGGVINGAVTGGSTELPGLTVNLDVQPTFMPMTVNTTNNNTIAIGDRVIDTITTRVAETLDVQMRKAP